MWSVLDDLTKVLDKTGVEYETTEYMVKCRLVEVRFSFKNYSIVFNENLLKKMFMVKQLYSGEINYNEYLKAIFRNKLREIIKENEND